MPRKIMIGQLPLIIEEDEKMGQFDSSSRHLVEKASPKDSEVLPVDVISNAHDDDTLNEELNQKLGCENQDVNHTDGPSHFGCKRKHSHRHTQHQIHEMEEFFKLCSHPDDKQRKQLSHDLGLEPLQVKFWFQNKRTQMKTHLEHVENACLITENEKLRSENIKLRESLTKASCVTCGNPQVAAHVFLDEHQLKVENSTLKEEIARMTSLAAKYVCEPYSNDTSASSSLIPSNSSDFETIALRLGQPIDIDKSAAMQLVISAMEELIRMTKLEFPLWISTMDTGSYLLNEDAYNNLFPKAIGLKLPGFNIEASKGIHVVMMNHINLVEVFMDMDKWLAVFASIISRATILEVISAGPNPGNFDGTLQMMTAEYQVLAPTIPIRESTFLRYCKQLGEGTWGIVDVSFDNLFSSCTLSKCQRRPSGCIIQEMPNGCSKIIWVEHAQVQDEDVHYLGKPFVEFGLAFGAQRYVSVLVRQCERLTSAMMENSSLDDINDTVLTYPEGRKNILKLSERMVLSFYGGVSSSTAYGWWILPESGNDQIRVMTKKSENDPGKPSGVVISATTSFWLPISHKLVFEFLCDESSRNKWDILFDCGDIQEIVHIMNGSEVGNYVSVMRGENSRQGPMQILQECGSHLTGSYIVYAPIDNVLTNSLLASGNPDHVELLPSGFTIYPSAPTDASIHSRAITEVAREVGSLVTVAFQILVNPVTAANFSTTTVSIINDLMEYTSQKIRAALTTPRNP
ncbi:hypothetical protein ACH5RR_023033 [Cinchona calisaya]|uniref:Uncharacterized protein n=1 Tax=Cinchona calisaya TaxID=153742 RepID=A0ABD2ZBD2_9GENT